MIVEAVVEAVAVVFAEADCLRAEAYCLTPEAF